MLFFFLFLFCRPLLHSTVDYFSCCHLTEFFFILSVVQVRPYFRHFNQSDSTVISPDYVILNKERLKIWTDSPLRCSARAELSCDRLSSLATFTILSSFSRIRMLDEKESLHIFSIILQWQKTVSGFWSYLLCLFPATTTSTIINIILIKYPLHIWVWHSDLLT